MGATHHFEFGFDGLRYRCTHPTCLCGTGI